MSVIVQARFNRVTPVAMSRRVTIQPGDYILLLNNLMLQFQVEYGEDGTVSLVAELIGFMNSVIRIGDKWKLGFAEFGFELFIRAIEFQSSGRVRHVLADYRVTDIPTWERFA